MRSSATVRRSLFRDPQEKQALKDAVNKYLNELENKGGNNQKI